ncbi:MAG: hypothetical protein QM696_07485 [Steroidobacteraceae bacterium]
MGARGSPAIRQAGVVALLLLAIIPREAESQDVFGAQPLQARRNCSVTDPGPYIISRPPSCATRIAEGRRQYGVEPTFMSLRESRQIPASWQYGSPWGPCVEGESMLFLTPAGKQLYEQTAGQCDEQFAATAPSRGGQPSVSARPGGAPVPDGMPGSTSVRIGGDATASSMPPSTRGQQSYIGTQAQFPCVNATRPGVEYVRGLPGGAQCVLRENDALWCRQRQANSYNPYLPTNAAWPLQPVGVRITPGCRIEALEPAAPQAAPPPGSLLAECCRTLKGSAVCPVSNATLLANYRGLDRLRRMPSCPAGEMKTDRVVGPVELGTPVGDPSRWAAGLVVGTADCLHLTLKTAGDIANAINAWDWPKVEQLLGLARRGDVEAGIRANPVIAHRLLQITVQTLQSDLARKRLGAFSQEPGSYPQVTDYQSGVMAGQTLCAYGMQPSPLDAGHGAAFLSRRLRDAAGAAGRVLQRAEAQLDAHAAAVARARAATARAEIAAQKNAARRRQLRERREAAARPLELSGREVTAIARATAQATRVDATVLAGQTHPVLQASVEYQRTLGAEVAEHALENTVIQLPAAEGSSPSQVAVGRWLGQGSFSAVYEILDEAGKPSDRVIKVSLHVGNYDGLAAGLDQLLRGMAADRRSISNNLGGDMIGRQVRGSNLFRRAGIETPPIDAYYASADINEPGYVIQRRIDVDRPGFDDWGGSRLPRAEKELAARELHDIAGRAGFITVDSAPYNLYFYRDRAGKVRAGTWDTDLTWSPDSQLDTAGVQIAIGVLTGFISREAEAGVASPALTLRREQLLLDIDWTDPVQAMQHIKAIRFDH